MSHALSRQNYTEGPNLSIPKTIDETGHPEVDTIVDSDGNNIHMNHRNMESIEIVTEKFY